MTAYISLPTFAANVDERLRIIAGQCAECGTLAFPQRAVCIKCSGDGFTDRPLSGHGTLYTFTVVAGGGAPAATAVRPEYPARSRPSPRQS